MEGGEIEKEIKILVQNINDSPFLNKEILLPEIFQDQKFDFLIPQNSFDDPDFLISSEEKLDYSILDNNGTFLESDFITFNEKNILNFSPTQINIGSHEFRLRATDKDGKYAEQLITLNIKNKNDAPVFTKSFETFKSFQTNSLDLNLVSEEERKNLIFIDSKTSLDLNSWVNDVDKVFDINESLTFHLEIMDNEGQVFEINNSNNAKYNWISFSNNTLEINATENNIGLHYIRFIASDSLGETISNLFQINVRHKNRAPIINENFLSEDLFSIKGKGILNSSVIENNALENFSYSKVLLVSLEEESEINFKLPNLFLILIFY